MSCQKTAPSFSNQLCTIFFSLFTKFIYLNDFLFYVLIPWYVKYSSSIFKNKWQIWLFFFLFSTKNLSSVVKMMMTVSKQRAGGGVPDMDDKQSLIDDLETGDWCLSLICCYNVVFYDYFYLTFSLLHPLPKKRRGLNYCSTLPSIWLIYTRLKLTNIILHEKSIDKKFL